MNASRSASCSALHSCAALVAVSTPSVPPPASRPARMHSRIACLPQRALKASRSPFLDAAHSLAPALELCDPLWPPPGVAEASGAATSRAAQAAPAISRFLIDSSLARLTEGASPCAQTDSGPPGKDLFGDRILLVPVGVAVGRMVDGPGLAGSGHRASAVCGDMRL